MNDLQKTRTTLGKYFSIYIRGRSHWVMECDKCDARWALDVSKGTVAGGNILHLLNHAYGHIEQTEANVI